MSKRPEKKEIPAETVRRLSLYLRTLRFLERRGVPVVSSAELTHRLEITAAQARRDLAYFGSFGRPGVGYEVAHLRGKIERILGLDRRWDAVLVGAGKLGTALLEHPGFRRHNIRVAVAFDSNPQRYGRVVAGVPVLPVREMEQYLRRHRIRVAVITVPARTAQEVTDRLVAGGVTAILNFAPRYLELPERIAIRSLDMAMELEGLVYHLAAEGAAPLGRDAARPLSGRACGPARRRNRPRGGVLMPHVRI